MNNRRLLWRSILIYWILFRFKRSSNPFARDCNLNYVFPPEYSQMNVQKLSSPDRALQPILINLKRLCSKLYGPRPDYPHLSSLIWVHTVFCMPKSMTLAFTCSRQLQQTRFLDALFCRYRLFQ